MHPKTIISIVVPIFNEELNIKEFHKRTLASVSKITSDYELIFVNDGSKDNSSEILKKIAEENKRIYYINLSRNFGHQIAVMAGLDFCKGESIVIIDGDLQDPPELIVEMYKNIKRAATK